MQHGQGRQTRRRLPGVVALVLAAAVLFVAPAANAAQTAARVDVGGYHSCAVKSGRGIVCWGYNSDGQAKHKVGGGFKLVSSGGLHSCGVKKDHTVRCWGSNASGQAPATPSGSFTAISAGGSHTCGLKIDGSITCWGDNSYGQAPGSVAGSFTSVSAGEVHTCAVKADQSIACWGWDDRGQAPPTVAGDFLSVSAGGAHTCAVKTDHTVICWGSNRYGQASPPAATFKAVSAGNTHTCGVRGTGAIACWGLDSYGEAPPGVTGDFLSVSSGDAHTCAVTIERLVRCWGDDSSGQLGARPARPSPAPPNGSPGTAYSSTFTSSLGVPKGEFRVTAGSLPPGLTLRANGNLSGTPTTAGTFTFTVSASNIIGIENRQFSISIGSASADFALTQSGPANAAIGSTYATTVTVKNNGPDPAAGSLTLSTPEPVKVVDITAPSGVACSSGAGVTLSATCTFSGSASLAVGASVSVTVKLASGQAQQITVHAHGAPDTAVDMVPGNDSSASTTEAVEEAHVMYTSVGDGGFAVSKLSVPNGRAIFWNNSGPGAHAVDDATGLDLFSLIGEAPVSFGEYRFYAAGSYKVLDGSNQQMVKVRIKRSANQGTTSTPFDLTWGSHRAPVGYRYVVAVHRPGQAWSRWKHTRVGSGTFTPDAGTGTYWFRCRLKRMSDDASTGWSRTSIVVS
jgi:alpha-tubulin suppressor-like RCC1 family protein